MSQPSSSWHAWLRSGSIAQPGSAILSPFVYGRGELGDRIRRVRRPHACQDAAAYRGGPAHRQDKVDVVSWMRGSPSEQNRGDETAKRLLRPLGIVWRWSRCAVHRSVMRPPWRRRRRSIDLDALFGRIDELSGEHDAPQRIQLLRRALTLVSPEGNASLWGVLHSSLGQSLAEDPTGDPAENIEQAIKHSENALSVWTREALPEEWAITQYNLGNFYQKRVRGDPGHNFERAIGCYVDVLEIVSREDDPAFWGDIQLNLGSAYVRRGHGPGEANVERGIACLERAAEVFAQVGQTVDWAKAQHGLGVAYLEWAVGKRAEHVEKAISCLEAALEGFTGQHWPVEWGSTLDSLGNAYATRIHGDRAENLERAIRCHEAALQARPRERLPDRWAETQLNLGSAYGERIRGDPGQNIEHAIRCFDGALEILTPDAAGSKWSLAQHNRGTAYLTRVEGGLADNVERAIASFEEALLVRTRDALPELWAETQHNLGNAYRARVRGERAGNRERAITCYENALEESTRIGRPLLQALAQYSLGSAYADRLLGDRRDNLLRAAAYYEASLGSYTRERFPLDWARTQNDLGSVRTRVGVLRGDAADLVLAIGHHEAALQVYTRHDLPRDWASTQHNLGDAYHARARLPAAHADHAADTEQAVQCYEAALQVYTRDALPLDWALTHHQLGIASLGSRGGGAKAHHRRGIASLEGALDVLEGGGPPDARRSAGAHLGDAYARADQWGDAARAYASALEAAELLYASALLRSGRDFELTEIGDLHARAAYALVQIGRVRDAVVALEQGRARALGDALTRDMAALAPLADQAPETYQAFRAAAERMGTAEARNWRNPEPKPVRPETAAGHQSSVEDLEKARRARDQQLRGELEAARGELDRAVEQVRQVTGFDRFLQPATFGDIAAAVRPGWPLAYLAATPVGSLALLAYRANTDEPDSTVVESVPGPRGQGTALDDVRAGIDRYRAGQLGDHAARAAALGDLLPLIGEQLVEPLARRLVAIGATGVVLVACRPFTTLPLHAASWPAVGLASCCLLDEVQVAYAPSARVLAVAHDRLAATSGRDATLAGVGNPLPTPPGALISARPELEEIAALFGSAARPLYEQAATSAALAQAADGATHVHLACHGRYEPDAPFSSRLELAGEPLTLREVLAERPFADARLVVASACQTAMTDSARLADETLGFPAGFLHAGVPGVIGTLWPVGDLSAALVMVRLYEYHLRGDGAAGTGPMDPPAALQQAALWLRDLTGEGFLRFVEDHPRLREPAERLASSIAMNPDIQPFSQVSVWAPYVFVGV